MDLFPGASSARRGIAEMVSPPLSVHEACRITEIAIKAQQAADTKAVVSLSNSPYHTP